MREIDKVIIHCSDTPRGRNDNAADIDRWHKARGFSMIGYHYVILLDGTIERGRKDEVIGAHCKGYNSTSIGVCYIGGAKGEDTRTDKQKKSMEVLLQYLKLMYPKATIHGHKDFANKSCPSFEVSEFVEQIEFI